MNIYSKYFTVEDLHFHLWNEIYNFVYENWDNCEVKIPVLARLKHRIMQEFKNRGIIYRYNNVRNDCFLCEEYSCNSCPLRKAYESLCMTCNSYYSITSSYFYNCYLHDEKADKEKVLLSVAKVRDCYSNLNGDC